MKPSIIDIQKTNKTTLAVSSVVVGVVAVGIGLVSRYRCRRERP